MNSFALYAKLYQTFGVSDYARKLTKDNHKEKLAKLNKTITDYILVNLINELPQETVVKLEKSKTADPEELLTVFTTEFGSISDKIVRYGRKFRRDLARG